jgi:hypothetical protein
MQAYRVHLVIQDSQQVTVSNLPFRPGQRVEVLFLAQDENRAASIQELESLLKETQALPHLRKLSEADIAAEIAAFRSER